MTSGGCTLRNSLVFGFLLSALAATITPAIADGVKSFPHVDFDVLVKTHDRRDGAKVRVKGVLHRGSGDEGTLRKDSFSLGRLFHVHFANLDSKSRKQIYNHCRPECEIEVGGIFKDESVGRTIGSIELKAVNIR